MNKIVGLYPKSSYIQVVDHFVPMELTAQSDIKKPYQVYFPFAKGVIELSGKDTGTFLQALTTNDILSLSESESKRTLFTNPNGKILFDCFIRKTEDKFLLVTDPGDEKRLIEHLEFYHITEDVKLKDVSANYEVFFILDEENNYNGEFLKAAQKLYESKDTKLKVYLIPADETHYESLTKNGVQPIGLVFFEDLRPLFGFARAGVDFGIDQIPQEASLENCISLSKGCFTGQEPIARLTHRGQINKKLKTILSPQPLRAGCRLFLDQKEVGLITSASPIKTEKGYYSLGYIKTKQVQDLIPQTLIVEDTPVEISVQPE
ncbi:MAG: hypothetical protein OEY59_06215 [Deltaproteobacteria bacterium]|nr:hypothetical protein [Deltaproteobacteria bacterium]